MDIDVCVLSPSVMSDSATPWIVACQAHLSIGFPKQDTGVGYHFLLLEVFLTQELNLCLLHLLHCRQILYGSSH